jgi:hypothetical protein
MACELEFDDGARTDEDQAALQPTAGNDGAADDAARRVIAAHRVDGDAHLS